MMHFSLAIIASLAIVFAISAQAAPSSESTRYPYTCDYDASGILQPLDAKEQALSDRLAQDFSDVINLDSVRPEKAERLLKYYKARGELLENDKYAFDDLWPEPYNTERGDVRFKQYQAELKKGKKAGILEKLTGRSKKASSSSSHGSTTRQSYESDEDDPESTFQYCQRVRQDCDREYHGEESTSSEYDRVMNQLRENRLAQARYYLDHGFGEPETDWDADIDEDYGRPIVYAHLFKWLQPYGVTDIRAIGRIMKAFGNRAIAENMLIDDEEIQKETAEALWHLYQGSR